MDETALGEALQAARKKAGLTQQELCHKAGLSYSTLAKIERGAIKSPSIFTISQIAQVLDMPLDQLVGGVMPALPGQAKKVSKSGIRFVYFDVNGCLVRFYERTFGRIAEDSGKSADQVESLFWHSNNEICRGDISLEVFNQRLAKQYDLPGFDWLEYYLAAVEPVDAMIQLLQWAAANYQVGLLTNIMPGILQAMTDQGLLPALPYDAVIDSSEVKALKPEAEIFEIAAKQAGVRPEEILLIDNDKPNITAAGAQGWQALRFNEYRPDESIERIRKALALTD